LGALGTGVAQTRFVAPLSTLWQDESFERLKLILISDLLVLGLGKDMRPISPKTRQYLNSLGIRIDIQDTRNAAAQFNLLATERGVGSVAAALVPIGWKEEVGIK
jgi:NADH dehydrogenase [ubiquinone] 1 alpha subcomplex assembly factor 3